MASALIHLSIAKELENELDIDNKKDYYLGSIAPDISKQIGEKRDKSHFSSNMKDGIPNMNLFVKRYPTFKYNSFNLGYFIHLYTDKLWREEVFNKIISEDSIKLADGTILKSSQEEIKELVYSDYTNLNRDLIDTYNLDLSLFYEDFQIPDTPLNEIPINKLDILINKFSIIIENSKQEKKYIIDMNIINDFIKTCTKEILEELKKY
jgi:hypothetical protein